MQFTDEEKERIMEEILAIYKEMNNDILSDLEVSSNNLKELFQEVYFGQEKCDSLKNFNKRICRLQEDTINVCNEIKSIINNEM